MFKYSSCFDTHQELVVQPYRGGIRLVKPGLSVHHANNSVGSLYQLPIGVCFMDSDHHAKHGNETLLKMINALSVKDLIDTTAEHYWKRDLSDRIQFYELKVQESQSMMVVEETGLGIDGITTLQGLSFKYPWYYEDRIIGVFNYTLPIDPSSLATFSSTLAEVMATGLLGPNPFTTTRDRIGNTDVHFTTREAEVLNLLLKGHTAKSMAIALKLSPRTIEHYIENIRLKANCASKTELIQKYSD